MPAIAAIMKVAKAPARRAEADPRQDRPQLRLEGADAADLDAHRGKVGEAAEGVGGDQDRPLGELVVLDVLRELGEATNSLSVILTPAEVADDRRLVPRHAEQEGDRCVEGAEEGAQAAGEDAGVFVGLLA